MNREQQRRNAKEERRLQTKRRIRSGTSRPSEPVLTTRRAPARAAAPLTVAEPRRRRLPAWWPWVAAAAASIVVIALVVLLDPLGLRTPLPGAKLASQGNRHINPGDTHQAYITDPPASGPHFPSPPNRGIYTTPWTTEYLVHFLEHGGAEVLYNKTASDDTIKKLTDIVNKALDVGAGQVLLAPRPDMPCQVALTAWQRIETFGDSTCNQPGYVGHPFDPKNSKDVGKVSDFVARDQCAYDPENICGGGAHGKSDPFATPKPGEATVTASLGTATPGPGASPAAPAAPTPAP